MPHFKRVAYLFHYFAMSYYKIINGAKYDKQLWELATEFTTGEGDGRISQREMQLIVKLAQDGRGVTEIEKATLLYIRQNFNLTEAAATWLDAYFYNNYQSDIQAIIQKIGVEEFDLPQLRLVIEEKEVKTQEALPLNKISFEEALRLSLNSFLKNGEHIESPRSLVENVHELYRDKFESDEAWDAALTAKVREYLSENSKLVMHPLRPLTDEEDLFAAPEDGETTHQNWIFQLSLRNLSDHLYWAITDRNGEKPTYNYGFN